jgi:hypothetical protein
MEFLKMAALGEAAGLSDRRQAGLDDGPCADDRDSDNQGQCASRQRCCARQADGQSSAHGITVLPVLFATDAWAGTASPA